jgi:hypothetical protein
MALASWRPLRARAPVGCRSPLARWLPALVVLGVIGVAGCDGALQQALDDLAGKPKGGSSSSHTSQHPLDIPAGPHLYCITNIGHTLVLYDLATDQVQPQLQTYLDLDPVGPWFYGSHGYYISRVDTSGHGSNALIEFDPKTAVETRRLGLGVNTNPNTLFILPNGGSQAWIAIRGSTFNNPYGPDGIGVVDLNTMAGNIIPLSSIPGLPNPGTLHSLISFVWDFTCPANGGSPCAYALVNGFDGTSHTGTLLVLKPDSQGNPVGLDSIPLGLDGQHPPVTNPLEDMLLDDTNHRLWVVNNGGFTPSTATGELQVLDTTLFGSTSTHKTVTTVSAGFAPTGIFGFDVTTAWVTTYPSDKVLSVNLGTFALDTIPGLPNFTGSVLTTSLSGTQLYAGAGGFGTAKLVRLDTSNGHLIAADSLQAGSGTVSCAQFTTP